MDVIVTHVNADFDGLGGLVGASCVYPGAAMVLPAGESPGVRDFLALHRELLPVLTPADVDPAAITRLIVVDTDSRRRLGAAGAWLDLPEVEVHLYDHHLGTGPGAEDDIPASRRRIESWGAVSTVLCAELRDRGLTPTPVQATAMLLGIYEDTGALSYAGTRAEDLEAAAWLLRRGADLDAVSRFSRHSLQPGQRRLLHALLDDLETREIRGVPIAIACAREQPYVEDASLLANRLLDVEGVDAVIILAPMEGNLYVIARSRPGRVDVGAALHELGGGGHARAASATVRDAEAREFRARLWELLPAFVRAEPVASELMSTPVRAVSPDAPTGEARRLMVRYGHSGLVVTEGGKLVGIVTRRDVDRARHHQLEHAPVAGIMTRRVRTAEPGTTLSQLEQRMISEGVGRLPVVRDGSVIGVVTRSDLLRARHGAAYLAGAPNRDTDDLAVLLRSRFPAGRQRLLELVGRLAAEEDAHAFLVGGIVRDLLLDVPGADIDILVEPDALVLAQRLAKETGGTWKDKRFGTARVLLPEGDGSRGGGSDCDEVELATARTESYAHPGALPDVEPSSVSDDLRRRDFTVNAMAVALRPEEFGRLLDPFRGREDLDRRQLRVLHNLSFVEDPTRLFRAVWFEERFHLEMEPHTEELARGAISAGNLSRISPERLREVLYRTFREAKVIGCLLRLQDLGVLQWLAPGLILDVPLLQRLPGAREWWENHHGDAVSAPLVYLAGTLAPLGATAALAVAAERLRLPPPAARRLATALLAREHGNRLLPADGTPSVLFRALEAYPPEALVLARASAAAGEDGERWGEVLERYLTQWRHLRLEISGKDLLGLGYPAGPALGQALERAFAARLDGKIQDREGELAIACAALGDLPSSGRKSSPS